MNVADSSDFHGLDLFDGAQLSAFEELAGVLSEICARPVAFVSLLAENTQWFKGRCGLDLEQNTVDQSVCGQVFEGDALVEIEDLSKDPRTRDLPAVIQMGMRFYADVPMFTTDGKLGGFNRSSQHLRLYPV